MNKVAIQKQGADQDLELIYPMLKFGLNEETDSGNFVANECQASPDQCEYGTSQG